MLIRFGIIFILALTTKADEWRITRQPADTTVRVGQSLYLGCAANWISSSNGDTGKPHTYGYQWYKNGVAIPGATIKVYGIPSVSVSDAGRYSCAASGWYYNANKSCTWNSPCNAMAFSRIATISIDSSLPPAKLSEPANGTIDCSLVVRLQWYKQNEASKYHLQLSDTSNFSNLVFQDTLYDTMLVKSGLRQGCTYFWRIKALDEIKESCWSEAWSFTTLPVPNDLYLLAYWNFEQVGKEFVIFDASKMQHDLIVINNNHNLKFHWGPYGKYCHFKNDSPELIVRNSRGVFNSDSFTVMAFVYISEFTDYQTIFQSSSEEDGNRSGYQIQITPTGSIRLAIADKEICWRYFQSNDNLISKNTTCHIAVSYSGTEIKFYFMGILDRTIYYADGLRKGNGLAIIGRTITNGAANNKFCGSIDEIKIYEQAVSDEIVKISAFP